MEGNKENKIVARWIFVCIDIYRLTADELSVLSHICGNSMAPIFLVNVNSVVCSLLLLIRKMSLILPVTAAG